jgi:uncharacterized protein (DUF433 family)
MPDHGHEKASETEAALMKETPEESCAVNGKPDEPGEVAPMVSCAESGSPTENSAVSGRADGQAVGPRLIHRDGVAYLEGCDVPVWRLEMARRAGSSADAQIRVFPSLTRQGLDLAFAYAQEHSTDFDPLIQYHSGASVPPEDEGDEEDEATFEAELDAMFTEHAEVFRRLAQ